MEYARIRQTPCKGLKEAAPSLRNYSHVVTAAMPRSRPPKHVREQTERGTNAGRTGTPGRILVTLTLPLAQVIGIPRWALLRRTVPKKNSRETIAIGKNTKKGAPAGNPATIPQACIFTQGQSIYSCYRRTTDTELETPMNRRL